MESAERLLRSGSCAGRRHDRNRHFGTGYSNLARLRAMPLDRVKLDPWLIADIESSERARVIVGGRPPDQGRRREIVAEAVEA